MKILLLIAGLISLAIGAVGAVLPLLPTTPFLFVAAICFAKSSESVDRWFKNTSLYKKNLESFVKGQGMTKKTKARILITITLLFSVAAYCMRNLSYGIPLIVTVWLGHVIGFVFFVKNAEEGQNHDE